MSKTLQKPFNNPKIQKEVYEFYTSLKFLFILGVGIGIVVLGFIMIYLISSLLKMQEVKKAEQQINKLITPAPLNWNR